MSDVTRILEAVEQGDRQAANELLPLVYEELRRLAAQQLANEKPGQTLQATALVHEAYLRLIGPANADGFAGRRHFFGAAAEAMRRILVEAARRRSTVKRGRGIVRTTLDAGRVADQETDEELLDLDDALRRLAERDPTKVRLVELRHFAGLTIEEAALVLGISVTTANRYWSYARAWLHQELAGESITENS